MRKNHLSLAVTAALMAGAQGAQAAYTAATVPDLEIYISGASAQDKGIDLLIRNVLQVNDGNLIKFIDDGTAVGTVVGSAQTAWTFTLDKTKVTGLTFTGSAAGGNPIVTIHKFSSGGSFNGVGPLLGDNPSNVPKTLNYMTISAANCGADNRCTTTVTTARAPDLGVADVNTEMFQGLNVPASTPAPPVSKASALLNEKEAAGVAFGIIVNNNLYNALQDAQIASGRIVEPAAGCPHAAQTGGTNGLPAVGGTGAVSGYGVSAGDDACMPSLSKAQVTALMDGTVKSWEKIQVVDTAGVKKALTDAVYDPATTSGIFGGVAPVVHCTRSAGSGTKATANFVFLNAPCTANAALPSTLYDVATGPAVMQMSGSGGVESCMSDADNGTSTAVDVASHNVGLDFGGAKFWAFGIQSTENNAALAKPYRFVKIDGFAPSIKNVAEGKYIDWSEQAFMWRKDFSTGTWNTGTATQKAARLAILTQIGNSTGQPSVVTTLNAGFNHGFGQAGLLALASNGFAQSLPFVATNPVTGWTHKAGTLLDNCRAPSHIGSDQTFDLK